MIDVKYTVSPKMFSIKEIFIIVAIISTLWLLSHSVFANGETTLEKCQKSYNKATSEIVEYNKTNPNYKIILPTYNCTEAIEQLNATGGIAPVPPNISLRDRFGLSDCRFINEVHKLPKYNLEWVAYDIACEMGKPFDVKSPWEYTIQVIAYWSNLWNYIILKKSSEVWDEETRIVLGHTRTSRKVWEKLWEWDIIWQTDISGASTWIHVHIELWSWYRNVTRGFALGEEYNSMNWTALLNHRHWNFRQPSEVYYFTSYDLWDVKQNDSTPCIWASGKDLCGLERSWVRTMALTSDIRTKLGIKFWDKVRLEWDNGCSWIFQVEDEMNKRFRSVPWILRPWTAYYIKGDLPSKEGWACSVTKL